MKALRYLDKYLRKYRLKLFAGIIITVISRIFSLFAPRLIGNSLTAVEKFLSENQAQLEEQAIQTRKIIAEIGSNLVNQRGLIINELVGISIQKMAMDNMDDEDPSPFEGMNIIQAKKNLELQKKEIRDSAATDVFQISDLDHETIIKWSDLILEKGEFEANRWIKSKLNSQ